jgi:adenylate cyclase
MIKRLLRPSGFKISAGLTLLVLLLYGYVFLGYDGAGYLGLADKQLVDFALRARGGSPPGNEVAIVAVDTKAIDHFGQWPWQRRIMADLLHELQTHYQVEVMGYDVLFSEADTNDLSAEAALNRLMQVATGRMNQAPEVIDQLRRIRSAVSTEINNDARFGAELSKWRNVVLGYFFQLSGNTEQVAHLTAQQKSESASRLEGSEIAIIQGAEYLENLPVYEGVAVEANIPLFISKNSLSGFFNVIPDREDGTIRRIPLVIRYQDRYYPSLALQIVRRHLGDPPLMMVVDPSGIKGFHLGHLWIRTEYDGTVMVNYRGAGHTFPHYSVVDIIEHRVPVDKLKGKIVLLGVTEIGLTDLRTTPFGTAFPGVEIHANLIDNILKDDYFHQSDIAHLMSFVLILFFGLLVGAVLPRLHALSGLVFSLLLLIGYVLGNLWFLFSEKTWTSFVFVLGVILLNWFAVVLFKYFGEEKDKRFIKSAFQQYLSPNVIEQLVNDPSMLKLGGEKRRMTAFFSDVAGFSTISEALTPEELVELLNEYLTVMTDIIMAYDGTVDKFEGDAVIAFFGAPIAYSDHAARACLASLEMQRRLVEMREQWRKAGKHELFVRIGLNTGEMVVGNMGSNYRMDYTMMGDAVNLASRLEGANKTYQTQTLISQFTLEDCADQIEVREVDLIRVVGRREPIRIFEVLGKKGAVSEEVTKAIQFFAKGLQLYRRLQLEEAKTYFAQCNKLLKGDGPSQVFFERCRLFQLTPPPEDWDGVYQLTLK